jgi:hypothetical protein
LAVSILVGGSGAWSLPLMPAAGAAADHAKVNAAAASKTRQGRLLVLIEDDPFVSIDQTDRVT